MDKKCPSCGLEGIPHYVKVCDCGYDLETPTTEPLSDKKRSPTYLTQTESPPAGRTLHLTKTRSREMIIECPNCKYEGPGEKYKPGSGWIEFILWVFTFCIIGIIYTIWRLTNASYRCPGCGYNFVVKKGYSEIRDYVEINKISKIPEIKWSRKHKIGGGIFLVLIGIPIFIEAIQEDKRALGTIAICIFFSGIYLLWTNLTKEKET